MQPKIAILPSAVNHSNRLSGAANFDDRVGHIANVIETSGAKLVDVSEADALVWLIVDDADGLLKVLDENPNIRWVQLPWAGVEHFAKLRIFDNPATFTCAKGAFGESVAEHALMLILGMLRDVVALARTPGWNDSEATLLSSRRITILGAGGIAEHLCPFLNVAGCDITVLRRNDTPMSGATRTLAINQLHDVLPETDVLVLALPLTDETKNIIGAKELELLPNNSIVINVARGGHIDTDALTHALQTGSIAAAGLDVTEPEPLGSDHPLWKMDNVLITSHNADSSEFVTQELGKRIADNIKRFANNDELLGVVDPKAGY